jgi:hypothetical protein
MSGQPSTIFFPQLDDECELIISGGRCKNPTAISVVANRVRFNPYVRFPRVFFAWLWLGTPVTQEFVWHFVHHVCSKGRKTQDDQDNGYVSSHDCLVAA